MSTLKALKIRRGRVKACITRAKGYLDKVNENTTLDDLLTRLKTVEEYWQQFLVTEDGMADLQGEIDDGEGGNASELADPQMFEQVEATYLTVRSGLSSEIRVRQGQSITNSQAGASTGEEVSPQGTSTQAPLPHTNDVALPKIVIPPFSGEYVNWTAFRDLFIGSVDRKPNLSRTQKFYYLVSFLRGEAAELIKNIPISDEHYLEVWDKLEKRYDRPHLVALSHVKAFIKLPNVQGSNSKSLRRILDGADECLRGLNASEMNDRNPWLIYLLLNKLDADTRRVWAEEVGSRIDVTIDNLLTFLDKRFVNLESIDMFGPSISSKPSAVRSHVIERPSQDCLKCKSTHSLSQCPEFKSLNLDVRRKFAKDNALCYNCLKQGHNVLKCNSSFRCRVCNARHHTLVHSSSSMLQTTSGNASTSSAVSFIAEQPLDTCPVLLQSSLVSTTHSSNTNAVSSNGSKAAVGQSLSSNHTAPYSQSSNVILPTAIVRICGRSGKYLQVRALVDSGSQVSFITESCVQRLGLSRSNARLSVRGVASAKAGVTKGRVDIKVQSCLSNIAIDVQTYILNNITADAPPQEFSTEAWKTISHLQLADPRFNIPEPIELLLGADIVWSVFLNGKICIKSPRLFALNSIFGWIVSGQIDVTQPIDIASYNVMIDIDRTLQRFWEVEEGYLNTSNSIATDAAEIHFQRTHCRADDGRYIVELPFKYDNTTFGNTSTGAILRLQHQERRFARDPELYKNYVSFMAEYLALGHMQPIPENELSAHSQYYLPHHAVLKPDSTTTRLRVVFDGSFKDSLGTALNDTLLIGPPVQRDLVGVSLRFRMCPYVFTSDIMKMFRQIWIANNHRDFQRIVWRSSTDCPVQHFRLCTVTYGTASAPFLSVRVLQQLAHDNQERFPHAASILLNNVYVDDVLAGASSMEELISIQSELVELLATAGFTLRKWCSNCKEFLATLPKNDCEAQPLEDETSTNSFVKVLGLYWNPSADAYSFRVKRALSGEVTKRGILSEVARVFDIHGFLSPSTILMKILFQRLWLLKVDWDEQLPLEITKEWIQFAQSLHHVEGIRISRQIYVDTVECELHCFCDASQAAYAAVIYSVKRVNNAQPLINMLIAKARVTPLRVISIPRLELCAALLLCQLFALVKRTVDVSKATVYAWTDSEIVLHWLSSPPRNWKIFVANRTEEILSTLPRNHWNYVNTTSNPADCASRGLNPEQLLQHKLWWCGPEWMALPRKLWPKTKFCIDEASANVVAEKRKLVLYSGVMELERSVLIILADRCSSWNRLIRIIAYVRRFVSQLCGRSTSNSKRISFDEIHRARINLVCCVQRKIFAKTINNLTSNSTLSKKDPLIKLSPFIDNVGVLRVGGRIQNANVSFNIKHPIILPRNHISELIVVDMHEKYLHAGVSVLFAIVRQHYWILGARNLIRAVVFKCKRCFLLRRQTSEQMMANLPQTRVQPTRPFLNSGCDFAGPLTIKMTNCKRPRISKAYVCLFICMSVKAIHLELVTDLSSEAFVAAFRRFTSRRGKCSNLYTDNGTNFKGAHRLLDDMRKLLQKETTNTEVYDSLAKDGTKWHFIPPSAPHFGGLWESGVRSVKFHIRRVVGSAILSFEEMYTVLTQIEAIINSRPLCTISDTDLNPLTPSHFLVGEPLTAVPEPSCLEIPTSRLSHWKLVQNMVKGYWKQWSNEYLTSLQERPKWTQPQKNFEVGNIVIIKEPNLPPTKWLLGQITAVHLGQDNCVRVVTIKTGRGTYRRPVTKIALLPNC